MFLSHNTTKMPEINPFFSKDFISGGIYLYKVEFTFSFNLFSSAGSHCGFLLSETLEFSLFHSAHLLFIYTHPVPFSFRILCSAGWQSSLPTGRNPFSCSGKQIVPGA